MPALYTPAAQQSPYAIIAGVLDTNGKTPREQATKVTLRQLLPRG
jgi:hypothetical protein